MRRYTAGLPCMIVLAAMIGCEDTTEPADTPLDPDTAPRVAIDRFSADAGNLFVRTATNGLPAANEPIDFDTGPFITQGYAPGGAVVRYYNFDVMPVDPAPIYVLFREGESSPVSGQLNIVDVIPGDPTYNDFWQVVRVTVPSDYVANTVTSLAELLAEGYDIEMTTMLVNCPIVPEASTADLRLGGEDEGLVRGWFRDQVVFYFNFPERALTTTAGGDVPVSPIFVSFNINPGEPGGGPESGFVTEDGSDQTHNVVATLPSDAGYSPLWSVNVYDNAAFSTVEDLMTAQAATLLVSGAALVNCPIVFVES